MIARNRRRSTLRGKMLFMPPALMLALALSLPARGVTISGVEIPESLSLADGGPVLVLNGAGVREKFFFDIYIAALYLPEKTADARAILVSPRPASVVMHFLYREVSRNKITDAWTEGLAATHTGAKMQTLEPRLEKFNAMFRTVHEGDVIRLTYLPHRGTEVRIDGKWRGVVRGADFFHSLLAIWLGSHPISETLKQQLLGLE